MNFGQDLAVEMTEIPGLIVLRLPVHGDSRGWFKENWQREKMLALGLPDFGPVQNNVSFNTAKGATRGIHAEPWDKFVSVATGWIFGAWVDLREGESFGKTVTVEVDPSTAVFVPRGVGNAYQALEDATAYTYLVNDHWSADAGDEYTFLNLADETAAIDWPIPLDSPSAELSEKDRNHPRLAEVAPMQPKRILVLGADGQVGRALRAAADETGREDIEFLGRSECDLADPHSFDGIRWRSYRAVISAAAFTAVDAAETEEGRREAWAVNAAAMSRLAAAADAHGVTVVSFSSDYVFDGTREVHGEDEPLSPLGVYGQTKAAGDLAVAAVDRHYIIRTSWVIGDGHNFVRTMQSLCERGIAPSVVDDQIGRLSFAGDLASAALHLIDSGAEFGAYNVSSAGDPVSWAEIAAEVFELCSGSRESVTPVSTAEYYEGKSGIAPRPAFSTLDLEKICSTGFSLSDWRDALAEYLGR